MPKRNFAVIGHPIIHTMSPFIHQRLFELANQNGDYTILDISPDSPTSRLLFPILTPSTKKLLYTALSIPLKTVLSVRDLLPIPMAFSKPLNMATSISAEILPLSAVEGLQGLFSMKPHLQAVKSPLPPVTSPKLIFLQKRQHKKYQMQI